MKNNILLIITLLIGITSVNAQESAFEVLLPYKVDFLNASFCRETSDGHFLVLPGSECKILKLSQDGKAVDEITYMVDSLNDYWTWFGQLIDIPNDPTHYLAVAEYYDEAEETHNKFHIIKIDENLAYNPDEVVVVDLSDEVRHFWIESEPHWIIDEEGNLIFATVAKKWDDTYCLMYVKVTPDGEKTVVYDSHSSFENGGEVCAFVQRGDYYVMLAGCNGHLCQYKVSLDFVSDSIRQLNQSTGLLVYDNLQDSCFFATWHTGMSGFTPVWIDEGTLLIPTSVHGISHYIDSISEQHHGVGLWKLKTNGDVVNRVFLDVDDENNSGMVLEVFYNTQNPLLVQGNDVYLCYTPKGSTFSTPLRTVVCKFDTDLNLKWKRWYGEAYGQGVSTGMALTSDGGLLISGYGGPSAPYAADTYVLKITSDGYCSEEEDGDPLLKPFCCYPNPVEDQLHLEFSPDVEPVRVELFDLQGRLLHTQGNNCESIYMEGLPTGTYTLRVTLNDGTCYSDKVVKQ